MFSRSVSFVKVKRLLKIIVGDEIGKLVWSYIVNDLYVLGREVFKDFEVKIFWGLF